MVAAVADERDRALIHKAIEFVFSVEKSRSKPQGLSAHGHADYWRRFLDVPELAEHDRDQPILRTLLAEDNERVLALVLDPTTSTAVEDFANKLTTRRVVALFEPLVRELAQRNAATWNTTGDFFNDRPPGLTAVWRMWLDRSRRGEISPQVVTEAVKNTYQVAVPRNLDLVDEIEHHAQNLKDRPPGKFAVLARLSRAPERSVGGYVSTGAQRKRSQNPKSPGVVEAKDTGDGSNTGS